ncbi:MAG TPA: hypothetical protein VIW67_01030, partial [Terriglobales bacterium]
FRTLDTSTARRLVQSVFCAKHITALIYSTFGPKLFSRAQLLIPFIGIFLPLFFCEFAIVEHALIQSRGRTMSTGLTTTSSKLFDIVAISLVLRSAVPHTCGIILWTAGPSWSETSQGNK